jgi:hypothetical protein
MPNLDPQLAAEFAALEKLRLAILQYRDEVVDLRKSRGLSALANIPRIESELPEEFQALVNAAKVAARVAPPVVQVPVAPLAAPPVVQVPVVPLAPPVVQVPVAPPVVQVPTPVSPAAIAAKEASPAAKPAERTERFEERVRTSPFALSASPSQILLAPRIDDVSGEPLSRYEPGLAARAEVIAPRTEITETKASSATLAPVVPRVEAKANEVRTQPPISPSIPNRRPVTSPSIQFETVGSFLRRFRLANE